MNDITYAIPKYITASDLVRVRKKLNLNQKQFSKLIGVSVPTIERWERKNSKIDGPIVLLLQMIEKNIDYILQIEIPSKKMPLRLIYMYNNFPCTLIDVNPLKQIVEIKNFTNDLVFQAFGNNLKPTYKDFEEFLKSRCFPEDRDKLKLVLKDIDLPFYDPIAIIEKTQGRMAEDDFWLKIEE